MFPILRLHRRVILTGLVSSLGMLLLQTAGPRVVMAAIDDALVSGRHSLTPYVVILLILGLGRFALGYVYRYNLQRTSLVIEYDLRTIIHEHLSRLSFSYFDRVQTGQLISRANSDIRSVQMFLAFAPVIAISMIGFVAAFILMAAIHLPLTVVALITLPGVYFAGARMRSVLFPVSWIVQARMADVATIVEENVTGTRVVKSFAAEPQQIRLLARAAERLRWANNQMVDIRARYAPLMQNLPRLGLILVLLYGGKLAIDGDITIGTLVAFNSYVLMLQMPFMMLGFLMMLAQRAAASAGRIFEILDEAPEIVDRPGAIDLVDPRGDVTFDSVHFGYGARDARDAEDAGGAGSAEGQSRTGTEILSGFDLHLAPGETVALVGRTGCGKSTVARLLPRFYDVWEGAVRIDGIEVRDLTLESLRAHIGLVLDEPFLFSESIRENIAYGRPDASLDDIRSAAQAAGAEEFIERLPDGYDTVVGERGYTLSGGQRQRIAIARTLLVNPRILILDDATSAIDVQIEQEIHDALRTLMQGRTTLVIAHRLSTIGLADRVVLMQDGRIVASGTHADLMRTTPAYAEVLAHAEEEWQAAHAPPPETPEEDLPPRVRAMRRLAAERDANGDGVGGNGSRSGIEPTVGGIA